MELRNALLKTIICLGALALAAALPLYPVLWGEIPVDLDGLLTLAPWSELRPNDFVAPAEVEAEPLQRTAWQMLTARLYAEEKSLLWNPYSDCGMPHYALWHTRTVSPFSLLLYVVPPARAFVVSAFLKLLVAGVGAFLLARTCGAPRLLAVAVALAFQWSGLLLTQLALPAGDAMPWLPLLFLCFERSSRGASWWWLPIPGVLGLMLLGGAPILTGTAFVGGLVFMLVRVGQHRLGAVEGSVLLVSLAIAAVLGIGLAAFQVLPFLEFARLAEKTGMPAAGPALGWRSLAGLIAPGFAPPAGGAAASAAYSFFGVAPLCLIPLWLALRPFAGPLRRSRVDAWYVLALGSLAAARLACFETWPGFLGGVGPGDWLAWEGLILALAAAETADEWVALSAEACRAALGRLLYFGPLPLLAGAVLLVLRDPAVASNGGELWVGAGQAVLIGLAMLILVGFTLLWPRAPLMGTGLALLIGGQLFFAFQPQVPFSDAAWLFPRTQFIEGLAAGEGRVAGLRGLREWPLLGNAVSHVYGPGIARLRRHAALAKACEAEPLLLRRLGAQAMLLTRADITGPFAPVRPELKLKHVFPSGAGIFGDLESKSRVRMVYQANESNSLPALPAAIVDPSGPATVEGRLPALLHPPSEPPSIRVVSEDAVSLRCEVSTETPGLLVVADTWYPGWSARVNGKPQTVYPVDRFSRGIVVEPGDNTVELAYVCKPLRRGLMVSAASAVLVILAGLLGLIHRRRQTTPWWAKRP